MASKVQKAAEVLKTGGIVIFPTETVFGIGCLITNTASVNRLYQIKQREKNKPSLCLVRDLKQAREWVEFDPNSEKLAQEFWPGPLTICLKVKQKIPEQVLGKGNTLGVRESSHPFVRELLELVQEPLLAPSANFQGLPAPRTYSEIDKRLASLVDYVVDIEPKAKKPSTIVTFERGKYNIVREGEIKGAQIEKVLEN